MLALLLTSVLAAAFEVGVDDIAKSSTKTAGQPARVLSEAPPVEWNKTYGRAQNEFAWDLVQTSDGGYALAGETSSMGAGSWDFWLVKTDAAGNHLWNKTYGGTQDDHARALVETDDGGYALAGYTRSFGAGSYDFWLVKTDAAGNHLWNKTYGGAKSDINWGGLVQTSDGGYALAGQTESFGADYCNFWLVKTDPSGNKQWDKAYEGKGGVAYALVETSDGGYAMAGGKDSILQPGTSDDWLVKTDGGGNEMWSRTYGGTKSEGAYALVATRDGGYAYTGATTSFGADNGDCWLVKTDAAGNLEWRRVYERVDYEMGQALVQTSDSGYAIAGYTLRTPSDYNMMLIKTDENGIVIWDMTYGQTSDYTVDEVYALVETSDDGYALAGQTRWGSVAGSVDFWLVKAGPGGASIDDLWIANVEPIQVVLDAKALVANKSTAIRATIFSTFASRVLVEINVTYDFGRKWYLEDGPNGFGIPIDPGLNRVYIPGGPVKPTAHPSPWESQDNLLWTSIGFDSNIEATVDPLDKVEESDEANNQRTCGMKVVGSKRLKILVVPVSFPGQESFTDIPYLKSEMEFLLGTYPVADNEFSYFVRAPWRAPFPVPDYVTKWWLSTFIAPRLRIMAELGDYDRVVAVLSDQDFPEVDWEGITFDVSDVAFVFREWMLYGHWNLIAHEIGHTYSLEHPQDGGPDVYQCQRYWVAKRDYERQAYTFMEVRDEKRVPPSWIDKSRYDSYPKHTYRFWKPWNLLDQLTFNPHVSAGQEVIVIRGLLYSNETIRADDAWYRVQERIPDIMPGTSGNYSIVFLDNMKQEISRIGFNASFSYFVKVNGTWVQNETEVYSFVISIPYIAETTFIEIRNASDQVLLSRALSPNAPTVSTIFPNGGETLNLGSNYTITWEALDVDGDPLSYFAAFSMDGGENWIPLALDTSERSYVWDTSDLPSGNNYLVKIIATDGINTGEDFSDSTFTLLDLAPPSIHVMSPQNKTYFNNLIPLTFETDEPTSWIGYSIDDQMNMTLNSNTMISIEDGLHEIVLYANDTSGNMGASLAVNFTVSSSFYDPWRTSFIGLGGYPIVDFAIYNGGLYAAAGNTLCVYDGSSWDIIDAPTYVTSLEAYQNMLLIGGKGGIYSYSGTTFTLVFSVSTYIKTLGVYNDTVYAGTFLDRPPTLYCCNGAAESPENWCVDTDFSTILNFSGPFGSIDSFAVYDDKMYVTSGGTVYSYNGTNWSIARDYDDVHAFLSMNVHNGKLYLATRDQGWRKPMYLGGSGFSGRVVEFDGENWTTILDHDYWIYSLETYDNKLYVGTANKILIYDGAYWSTSFNAVEGAYYAISFTVFDGKIYVGMGNGYISADPSNPPLETTIPEFSPTLCLSFLMISSVSSVFIVRKRSRKRLW